MRFDTHRIGAHLVEAIQRARPAVEVTDDGGDIIHVRLASGEKVYLYLIESPITVFEIRTIVEANTRDGVYTLFLLWCDLFLPGAGSRYKPYEDDWMAVFLALGEDQVVAFDPYAGQFPIFPVYLEGEGSERQIRYGATIDAALLHGRIIYVTSPWIRGQWHMATFEPRAYQPGDKYDPLMVYFDALGLPRRAGREDVKSAYRRLARLYHPDVNDDAQSTAQMQTINEAYERLMDTLDN